MAANTLPLRILQPSGWTSGLGNLLRKELHAWWGTRFWMTQALIWLVAINAIPFIVLWVAPVTDPNMQLPEGGLTALGLQVFFEIAAQFSAGGVAILGMGAIIGETQSGTAAWVLSKPLSRPAFVSAKLVTLAVGTLAMCVALPGAVAYLQIGAATRQFPEVGLFVFGLGLVGIHTLFYVALTIMLGTLVKSRGAVIGIAVAVLFGQQVVANFVGPFAMYLPHSLGGMAATTSMGQPLPSYAAIGVTAVLSVAFVVAALWRFEREEL
jgi:ABC-2 type transport system permease protein